MSIPFSRALRPLTDPAQFYGHLSRHHTPLPLRYPFISLRVLMLGPPPLGDMRIPAGAPLQAPRRRHPIHPPCPVPYRPILSTIPHTSGLLRNPLLLLLPHLLCPRRRRSLRYHLTRSIDPIWHTHARRYLRNGRPDWRSKPAKAWSSTRSMTPRVRAIFQANRTPPPVITPTVRGLMNRRCHLRTLSSIVLNFKCSFRTSCLLILVRNLLVYMV